MGGANRKQRHPLTRETLGVGRWPCEKAAAANVGPTEYREALQGVSIVGASIPATREASIGPYSFRSRDGSLLGGLDPSTAATGSIQCHFASKMLHYSYSL